MEVAGGGGSNSEGCDKHSALLYMREEWKREERVGTMDGGVNCCVHLMPSGFYR